MPVPISAPSRTIRARIANLSQTRPPNSPELNDLRRDLAVERLVDHITEVITGHPAPTPAQLERLAAIITNAAAVGAGAR
jgi:hypothetical protein